MMRIALLTIVLALWPLTTSAGDHAAFFGTWGTAEQCARAPIIAGGTVLAEPFEISRDWLRQGQFGCQLNWGPVEHRREGLFTAANAQCGEDTVRSYFLGMMLTNDRLTLRWDFPVSNGPLARCQGS